MTAVFHNGFQAVGTSMATIYTCPAATTALVLNLQIANVHASAAADINAQIADASNSNALKYLTKAVSVANKTAIGIVAGKVVLEAGDYIQLSGSASSSLEATIHVLELS